MTPEQEKLIKRVDSKLSYLINKKKTWVKVIVIQKITGWDKDMLEVMRENNVLEYRKTDKGTYEYCLESVPDNLIKKAS